MRTYRMQPIAYLILLALGSWRITPAQEAWVDHAGEYEYWSPGWSCRITPDGNVHDVQWQQNPVVLNIRLRADAIPVSEDDSGSETPQASCTFGPVGTDSGAPMQLRETGESKVLARRQITIGNDAIAHTADVAIEYELSPETIRLRLRAVLQCPLRSSGPVFLSFSRLDEDAFSARGMKVWFKTASPRLAQLPYRQTPPGTLSLPGAQRVDIPLDHASLSFAAGEGLLHLLDAPGWGGKFSLHAYPEYKWTENPRLYPAGTEFRWEYGLHSLPAPSPEK